MVDREKDLTKNIIEYTTNKLKMQRRNIENVLQTHADEMFHDILLVFHQLFQETIKLQENHEKEEISFITISFLNMGILRDTIELRVSLYDKNFYMDTNEVTIYYRYHHFDEIIKNDISDFNRYIEKKMIRVRYHEMYQYRKLCMLKYKSVMENCMSTYIEYILKLRSFAKMKKANEFKIIFNEFMCQGTILYESDEDIV